MNKKLLFPLVFAGFAWSVFAQNTIISPAIPVDKVIEDKVEKLLEKMTLEEKIGQMTELTIDVLTDKKTTGQPGFTFDEAMLDTVIGKYKVGSILNVPYGEAQTKEVWATLIKRIQEESIKSMGIPCVYGVDQIHGTTYTAGGTFFPQGVNMGATFNRELVRKGAEISAYETKAGCIPWTYAPVVDLGRDARWPRMWENYGEDCYVNTEMGRESVIGFQGEDPNHIGPNRVAACLKHYMGYGVPVSGKDRTPSSITVQEMREKHFAPFLESVKAGALSVMVNSAMNNGLPFHANYELLTKWLKEDLNWDGLIVTDWADINNLYTRDKVAASKKEAVKMAINAGIDMSMVPYEWSFCNYLKELVQEGEVPMSRIDDAVRRVLRMKFRLGLFDKPYWDPSEYPEFASKSHAATALLAAEESLVLLKNADRILPLASGKKILITGPNANSMRTLNGGWSYSWQGHKADRFAGEYNTILEAFKAKFGVGNVVYEPGVTYKQKGAYWEENAPKIEKAVVNIMLPGNYGGDALANLLAGDVNFSGKMPYTYPKDINSLVTYDYKPCEDLEKMQGAYDYDAVMSVQWAFGYGLSYTTFAYDRLSVNKPSFTAGDELVFTVDVTNTGDKAGKESVLLFSSDLVASLTPDIRRLRAFEKVELQPGETKTITLKVKGSDLAFVGYDGRWILEKGDFRIQTGKQTLNITCSETKKWNTPNK